MPSLRAVKVLVYPKASGDAAWWGVRVEVCRNPDYPKKPGRSRRERWHVAERDLHRDDFESLFTKLLKEAGEAAKAAALNLPASGQRAGRRAECPEG